MKSVGHSLRLIRQSILRTPNLLGLLNKLSILQLLFFLPKFINPYRAETLIHPPLGDFIVNRLKLGDIQGDFLDFRVST